VDEENFPQSKKFIPERWLKDNNDPMIPHASDSHRFSYLPFGFGVRTCIGRRFAELEVQVFVARLLREFRIEWHHPDMKFKSSIVNFPVSPLKFRFIDYET